jgi:hypothetical protein
MASKRATVHQIKSATLNIIERKLAVTRLRVATEVKREWERIARQRISKNLGVYLNSIVDVSDGKTVKIRLSGKQALTIEFGNKAYDVKDYLIGPKGFAHNYDSAGKFTDVPFTSSNRAITELVGHNIRARILQPMGISGRKMMSGKIKRVGVRETLMQAARRRKASPAVLAKIQRSGAGQVIKEAHRFRTKGGKLRFKSKYTKFMRVSRASGPWMKAATPGAHVVKLLKPKLSSIIKKALRGGNI